MVLALALQGVTGVALAETSAAEWMKKGDEQWAANQTDQAMESFLAAEKADPGSVEVLMKKAGLQMTTLHYSDAIETYQKAIGLNRDNAKAFIGMGICYLHSGGNTLAKAAFEEAIKIEPERKAQLEPALAKIEEAIQRLETIHEHGGNPHSQQSPHP
jgi:tetratricopeptide (TPR) repeat protein